MPKQSASAYLENLVGPLTLGGLLRDIREDEYPTPGALAAKLGITEVTLQGVECCTIALDPAKAAEWATILGYSPEQFERLARGDQTPERKLLSVTVDGENVSVAVEPDELLIWLKAMRDSGLKDKAAFRTLATQVKQACEIVLDLAQG